MSADLLRRAATRLRARANNLPGAMADRNWFIVQGDSESLDVVAACAEHTEDETRACDGCWTTETPHERAADYIALMHPPVALALAAWLERSAPIVASYVGTEWEAQTEHLAREPLAVARAILREPEVTP